MKTFPLQTIQTPIKLHKNHYMVTANREKKEQMLHKIDVYLIILFSGSKKAQK